MSMLDRYLSENQSIMDPLFNAIREGVFILDRDLTIVQANHWMEKAFADRQPLVGKPCHTLFRNTPYPCKPCLFKESMVGNALHVEVVAYPSEAQPKRWYEIAISPIQDEDGVLKWAIGHVKEITDQVQARQRLNDEIAWRRLMVDQSRDGIVVLDQWGKVHEANPRFAKMLGYSLAEMDRLHVWDWDTQWTRDQLLAMLASVDESGDQFETRHRRKDGSRYDVEISTNGLVHCGQKLVFCICRDITRRVSEKNRIEEALHLSRFSFDKVAIGIFRTDADARIVNVNRHACKLLGYNPAELCQMGVFDIDVKLDAAERQGLWDRMCEHGTVNFETVHRRKDGSTVPVDVTANLLTFQGARYCFSFVRDITERKKEQRRKREMEYHAQHSQRLEALGTLAGSIANDFNNILSSIYGAVELAQLRCAPDSKLRGYIDQIGASSVRAKNLIQQILMFSRQGTSEKRYVNISSVIREAVALVRATFPATIQIRDSIPAHLGQVHADESQLHQIVMNLCTNAFQAMQKEGGLLEIELESVTNGNYDHASYPIIPPGRYAKLTVADTGCGMDQAILDQIFDPYFTTRDAGEGKGMGLSTVHGIVQDHGGGIKAYSRPGVGTTLQIFLPTAGEVPSWAEASNDSSVPASGAILFVDDEADLMQIIKDFLEETGYTVDIQTCPKAAIEAIRSNPDQYDIVITDLIMPNMPGDKLIEAIRSVRPDMPVVLATGNSGQIENDDLERLGVRALLLKPIVLSDLADTIANVLGAGSN